MANEATITVADRRDDEGVVHWVETTVGGEVAKDHRKQSPACLARTMEYAKFEVDPEGNVPIGRLPRQ
jgi:hypothetical protein